MKDERIKNSTKKMDQRGKTPDRQKKKKKNPAGDMNVRLF
jgi:hypothetical protein